MKSLLFQNLSCTTIYFSIFYFKRLLIRSLTCSISPFHVKLFTISSCWKVFTFKIIIRQYLFANDISDSHFGHSYVFGKLSASSPWHACLKFIIVAKNTRKQFEEREPKGGANPDILFQLDFLYLRFLVLYSLKEEKTYSWKLTGKNVTWKLPLSCEAPFCLLPVMNMRVLSFYRLTALSVRLLLT